MANPVEILLALFWDLENSRVPKISGISHYKAVQNMKELLKKCLPNIRIGEMVACANTRKLSYKVRRDLYEAGVDLKDIPGGANLADYQLMTEIYKWTRKNPPPSYIVLITGDADFCKALGALTELGYTTLLAYPETRTANTLRSVADYTIGMTDFFSGKNLFSDPKRRTRSSSGVQVHLKLVNPSSSQTEDTSVVSTVFWDAASCGINISDHRKAIDYIRNAVVSQFEMSPNNNRKITMRVYGNSTILPATQELRRAMGPKYIETSNTKENSLETCMIVDMLRFTNKQATPSNVVLITGNEQLARAAQFLEKLGYNVYVVVPTGDGYQQLKDSGTLLFTWPPTLKVRRAEKEYYIPRAARPTQG